MSRPQSRSGTTPPTSVPKKNGVTPGIIILALFIMLIAGACGFIAISVQADLTQPVASSGAPNQAFAVHQGDTVNTVITNLEQQHLIRNGNLFKVYLKIKGKTLSIQPGTYMISPSMTLAQIIQALSSPPPVSDVVISVHEGLRLSQYADAIINSAVDLQGKPVPLPNFSKADFNTIAIQTGTFQGSDSYWYVTPWNFKSGAFAALEGYLMPNTYRVNKNATALDIIKVMLNNLGEQLCPGPSNNPDLYILNQNSCTAHQRTIQLAPIGAPYTASIGNPVGVFDALQSQHMTLPQALILASLAQREARSPVNYELVASTYYNRWQNTTGETVGTLGADPAEQYYLGSQANAASDPWAPLPDSPGNLPNNPYNLYLTKGLPPSAIAGVTVAAFLAGIDPPKTQYLYFYFARDCANHYFATNASFQQSIQQNPVAGPNDCKT